MKIVGSLLLAGVFLLPLAACGSSQHIDRRYSEQDRIRTPKAVLVEGPAASWVEEIDRRLRERGFETARKVTIEYQIDEDEETTKTDPRIPTRYVLSLQGYLRSSATYRCLRGGYKFEILRAELTDTLEDKTLVTVSSSGYTENCPPAISWMFGDIADAVDGAWQ